MQGYAISVEVFKFNGLDGFLGKSGGRNAQTQQTDSRQVSKVRA
jgi:hypothetical protein